MIVTAWNNGAHHESGAGYGLKIAAEDRDYYFSQDWQSIVLQLANQNRVKVNIDKPSFWSSTCRELIHQEIGRWLRSQALAPWPDGEPPKLSLEPTSGNAFALYRKNTVQVWTEQGKKEMLLDSLKYFPEELSKWCTSRGLEVSIPEGWPILGSIVIGKGLKTLEVDIADPDSSGGEMKLHRMWGLRIQGEFSLEPTLLGRWPHSWKVWKPMKVTWDEIDFGEYISRELGSYFHIDAHAAAAESN